MLVVHDYDENNRRIDTHSQALWLLILIFFSYVVLSRTMQGDMFWVSIGFFPIVSIGSLHVVKLFSHYRITENLRMMQVFSLTLAVCLCLSLVSSYAALPVSFLPFVYYWRKP